MKFNKCKKEADPNLILYNKKIKSGREYLLLRSHIRQTTNMEGSC